MLDVDARRAWDGDFYEHGNRTAEFCFEMMRLLGLAEDARERWTWRGGQLRRLEPRADHVTTHDVGFLFYPGIVLGTQLGYLEESQAPIAWRPADTLARRRAKCWLRSYQAGDVHRRLGILAMLT